MVVGPHGALLHGACCQSMGDLLTFAIAADAPVHGVHQAWTH